MEAVVQLKHSISRNFSTGSIKRSLSRQFSRKPSLDPRRNNLRFSFGRQSSLDPIRRTQLSNNALAVPENLDSTMQLLFMACRGDVKGVEDLLNEGVDVNSIDLDGRTALHIAACEGQVEVVEFLLSRKANINARDRWGSTAVADSKFYGHEEVYNILKSRGARLPKTTKTPMTVTNPREVPEYELNPQEIQVRRVDGISKGSYQVAKWNGTKVSVKILDKEDCVQLDKINSFKYELELLEKARHPNVVQFVGAVTQNVPMMIVLEYPSKGDLESYLQVKGRIAPAKVLRFALDIARGMNYLHETKPYPVIHCDLKPKHILRDSGGVLKVAGFGLVRLERLSIDKAQLANPEAQAELCGPYTAPEVYKNEVVDRSADAFSFGLVLYEMMEGTRPFNLTPPEEAARMMCFDGLRPHFKIKPKYYPPDLKELIMECWDAQPVVRPTFSEIIVRLDKIVGSCSKQAWWKDTFKLPWK